MLKFAFEKLFKIRESASRARPGADDGFDAHEKPFLDHLEDLRHCLIRIGISLAVATVVCFTFHQQIFKLIQIPAKVPLAEIRPGVSLWDRLDLISLAPPEFMMLMLKLSFYGGFIISFPFIVYFLFQFILPGLRQVEKKAIIPGAVIGFILFLMGVTFAFYFAVPVALRYFYMFENERISSIDPSKDALAKPIEEISLIGVDGITYPPHSEVKDEAEPAATTDPAASPGAPPSSTLTPAMREEIRQYMIGTLATAEGANFALRYDDARQKIILVTAKGGKSTYRIGEYINFIARLALVFGISFQLPVVVAILVRLELLTARVMRATRNYAWVIILFAAAIMTPPDVFTMFLLGGPMIILYEVCIIVATVIEKGREKRRKAAEEEERFRLAHLHEKRADELTEEEKAELHRAEIEQYEREHAHLFDSESEHVPHDHSDHGQYDESWHDDHQGLESDHAEPVDLTPGDDDGDTTPLRREPVERAPQSYDSEPCLPDGPVVDLNHGTLEELISLPGVGPKMAQVIIDHRPFDRFDDLEKVPGLGPEKIRKMMDRLMLG